MCVYKADVLSCALAGGGRSGDSHLTTVPVAAMGAWEKPLPPSL